MDQLTHFLKTKEEKQVRIPVPPKMPETDGKLAILVCPLLRISPFGSAQQQNDRCDECLHGNQSRRMCQVLREQCNQYAGQRQVSQRDPFERAACRTRFRKLPDDKRCEGQSLDRKSTRLNSSHRTISYAVF